MIYSSLQLSCLSLSPTSIYNCTTKHQSCHPLDGNHIPGQVCLLNNQPALEMWSIDRWSHWGDTVGCQERSLVDPLTVRLTHQIGGKTKGAKFVIGDINITGGKHQHTIKLELFSHPTFQPFQTHEGKNATESGDSFAKYLEIDKPIERRMRMLVKPGRLECTGLMLLIKFLPVDHNSRFGGEDK